MTKLQAITFLILIGLSSSCETNKILIWSRNNVTKEHIIENAIQSSKEGITTYLIVPIEDDHYALATNYALCGVLIDGRFDGKHCADQIANFYETKSTLSMSEISEVAYFSMLEMELVKYFYMKGANQLVKEMYNENCLPINNAALSHAVDRAAALLMLNVSIVQTQYHDFELTTFSCEEFR